MTGDEVHGESHEMQWDLEEQFDGWAQISGSYTRNSSHYEYAPAVIEKMIIKRGIIIVRL